jgi:hypothetical protein
MSLSGSDREESLTRASKDDLISSIRQSWTKRDDVSPEATAILSASSRRALSTNPDLGLGLPWLADIQLLTRIQNLEDARTEQDIETRELMRALGTLQSHSDTAFTEQSRLENDLEARDEVLERVRARLAMVEREVRDVQGRYNEQVCDIKVFNQAVSNE